MNRKSVRIVRSLKKLFLVLIVLFNCTHSRGSDNKRIPTLRELAFRKLQPMILDNSLVSQYRPVGGTRVLRDVIPAHATMNKEQEEQLYLTMINIIDDYESLSRHYNHCNQFEDLLNDINDDFFGQLVDVIKNDNHLLIDYALKRDRDTLNSPDFGNFFHKKYRRLSQTILHFAVSNNAVKITLQSLAHGANVNAVSYKGWTPLHYAGWSNAYQLVQPLVASGADINAQNIEGDTPLHNACLNGDIITTDVALQLLKNGADVTIKNHYGSTPLHYAGRSSKNHAQKKIALLALFNIDLNMKDNEGNTSLGVACKYGSVEAVSQLIICGADVNIQNKYDDTPLHHAAKSVKNGRLDKCSLLLAAKANPDAKNGKCETPRDILKAKGDVPIDIINYQIGSI